MKIINKTWNLKLSIFVLILFSACKCQESSSPTTTENWQLIWSEEFGSNLDNWNIWNGGSFNNELQLYQEPNLKIIDSCLVITPKRETKTGLANPFGSALKTFNFTSGRIETKKLFKIDSSIKCLRILARIKLPKGYGLWPAFWTYGNDWPKNGEIDIMEARGSDSSSFQSTYHFGKEVNKDLVKIAPIINQFQYDIFSTWHTYEVQWYKDSLIFIFDGSIVKKMTDTFIPQMFEKEQRIVLNLAVGGDFIGSNINIDSIRLNDMYVDWVRVYTK